MALSREENELTRLGKGTSGGEMLWRYWFGRLY